MLPIAVPAGLLIGLSLIAAAAMLRRRNGTAAAGEAAAGQARRMAGQRPGGIAAVRQRQASARGTRLRVTMRISL